MTIYGLLQKIDKMPKDCRKCQKHGNFKSFSWLKNLSFFNCGFQVNCHNGYLNIENSKRFIKIGAMNLENNCPPFKTSRETGSLAFQV